MPSMGFSGKHACSEKRTGARGYGYRRARGRPFFRGGNVCTTPFPESVKKPPRESAAALVYFMNARNAI